MYRLVTKGESIGATIGTSASDICCLVREYDLSYQRSNMLKIFSGCIPV